MSQNDIKLDKVNDLCEALAEVLDKKSLTEVSFEGLGAKIKLKREQPTLVQAAAPSAPVAPIAAAPTLPTPAATPAPSVEDPSVNAVTAPMIGTVYLKPDPSAPAFVAEGQQVKEGDTLCIIEAMKVMNPFQSPKAGKLTKVLVSDAQPVEFGEPLFVIE